jgi:hypothetical protein
MGGEQLLKSPLVVRRLSEVAFAQVSVSGSLHVIIFLCI